MKPKAVRHSPRLAAKACSTQAKKVQKGKKNTKLASSKCQYKGPAKR